MGLQGNRNKTATNEHHQRDLEKRQRRNGKAATIRERNRTLQRYKSDKVSISEQMDKNDSRIEKKVGRHT
jgi:hypothetical protein